MRFWIVSYFILEALRIGAKPWHFSQANGEFFDAEKGLFSKPQIEKLIPEKWRLESKVLDPDRVPGEFPVFLKPEWGQNSRGVFRADSLETFREIIGSLPENKITYLVQPTARGRKQLDVFYIRSTTDAKTYGTISVTECLSDGDEQCPICGIYKGTRYADVTGSFSEDDLERIWENLENIGPFRIARVETKCDSFRDLVEGRFKIVEINIFLPMPLNVLDEEVPLKVRRAFVRKSMRLLAEQVKCVAETQKPKNIFWRKVAAHFRLAGKIKKT